MNFNRKDHQALKMNIQCNICYKILKSESGMRKHQKQIHQMNAPYNFARVISETELNRNESENMDELSSTSSEESDEVELPAILSHISMIRSNMKNMSFNELKYELSVHESRLQRLEIPQKNLCCIYVFALTTNVQISSSHVGISLYVKNVKQK